MLSLSFFISFCLFLLQEGHKGIAEHARGFDTNADETANTKVKLKHARTDA